MANEVNFYDVIEDAITRQQISHRGGGIEIDLSYFGIDGRMSAYQNYLGGGILGRICSDCNVFNWKENPKLVEISENLKRYFHGLTNHEDSEWENFSYEQNQNMPISAY